MSGRVALVTGSSRGIGLATALALGRTDRNGLLRDPEPAAGRMKTLLAMYGV